jgi:hypothetical protein
MQSRPRPIGHPGSLWIRSRIVTHLRRMIPAGRTSEYPAVLPTGPPKVAKSRSNAWPDAPVQREKPKRLLVGIAVRLAGRVDFRSTVSGAAVAQIRDGSALLDGEIVAIDEHGRPSLQALHHQSTRTQGRCVAPDCDLADALDVRHSTVERDDTVSQVTESALDPFWWLVFCRP